MKITPEDLQKELKSYNSGMSRKEVLELIKELEKDLANLEVQITAIEESKIMNRNNYTELVLLKKEYENIVQTINETKSQL